MQSNCNTTNKSEPWNKWLGWCCLYSYENGWYPGQIILSDLGDGDNNFTIKFMHPLSIAGHFKYPSPPDVVPVNKTYIFACPIKPPIPTSGGRCYELEEYNSLCSQYKAFYDRWLFVFLLILFNIHDKNCFIIKNIFHYIIFDSNWSEQQTS